MAKNVSKKSVEVETDVRLCGNCHTPIIEPRCQHCAIEYEYHEWLKLKKAAL